MPDLLGRRMQIGMVVHDLEAAAEFWSEEFGVGPWIMFEDLLEGRRMVHKGQEAVVDASLAMSYHGETQVELITQHNDARSPYLEFLEAGREGVHHLEFWPDDYAGACETLQRAGFTEATAIYSLEGEKTSVYFESPPVVGVIIAVVPMNPFRKSYMSTIEQLALTWNGERHLRRFPTRAAFLESDDYRSVAG